MSSADNPSLWYGSLVKYKNGDRDDHTLLSAVIATFLREHDGRISELLGGAPTRVVVVPSTRGRPFEVHPLASAVRRIRGFNELIVEGLKAVPGATIERQEYKPSIFTVERGAVQGERVILVEDLWVSGSKATSGAGALLDAGARAVIVLPVAREYRSSTDFCPQEYRDDATAEYDLTAWPRS